MVNVKIIAVVAAVVIVVCAAAAAISLNSGTEKKGLYQLDAVVVEANMGRCSATPGVILVIEQLYSEYYGDLLYDYTLEDAMADTVFWNKYGAWDSIISKKSNGTYDVTISTALKGKEIKNIPECDAAVIIGTMHSETIYTLICAEKGVKPYSDESYANEEIKAYMNKTITGGMKYSYFEAYDTEHMLKYIDKSSYFDIGSNTTPEVEAEKLALALENAMNKAQKGVIFFGSGASTNSQDTYDKYFDTTKSINTKYKNTKNITANCAFFTSSTIPDIFSAIDSVGLLMGFSQETVDEVIKDIQVRLYNVYCSVKELTEGKTKEKVYVETYAGKAASTAIYKVIFGFLGFDTSMINGAEHDTESLLNDKPSLIVFFNNDRRPMNEKMRTNT